MAGKPVKRERLARRPALVAAANKRISTGERQDPVNILQEVLDVRVAEFRLAQQMVDQLPTEEWSKGQAHNWILWRNMYAEQLNAMCTRLVSLGIADRAVKVQEARAVLVANAVQKAATRAGLSPADVRLLGAMLREELAELSESDEHALEATG
jgi:hypothetical protein